MCQGTRQAQDKAGALRRREALLFHAMFLAPTVVIVALAALELGLRLWQLLG